jgi:hypothetical protein
LTIAITLYISEGVKALQKRLGRKRPVAPTDTPGAEEKEGG